MTNEQKIKIAKECGLILWGYDDYGEPEFCGTDKMFRNYMEALDSQK